MATYKEIQKNVKENYGVTIKTCWIADVKDKHGLISRPATNRISLKTKVYPCPEKYVEMIEDTLRFFKMIS